MAIKTKSIKISERAHWQLKQLAIKYQAHVWEIVDMAIVALKVSEKPRRTAQKEK